MKQPDLEYVERLVERFKTEHKERHHVICKMLRDFGEKNPSLFDYREPTLAEFEDYIRSLSNE